MDNNTLAYELLNQKNITILNQHHVTDSSDNNQFYCICVFCFDVELGQILESVYPSNVLEEQTLKNLTALSFPETNNSFNEDGELSYFFKFRKSNYITSKQCKILIFL